MFKNIYEEALKHEENEVILQVFKMILSGVARSGKSTFWKRLAIQDFKPSANSQSTGVAESHFISATEKEAPAHLHSEMLFDLHLYSETDTSDLDNEALCIYKHILESHKQDTLTSTHPALTESKSQAKAESGDKPLLACTVSNKELELTVSEKAHSSKFLKPVSNFRGEHPARQQDECDSVQSESQVVSSAINKHSKSTNVAGALSLSCDLQPSKEIDPISSEIKQCFEEMNNLLKTGEKAPLIKIIKKICHLIDAGGQRAFLEMLPTLTLGKALYLLFFNYENFEKRIDETVQMQESSSEVYTGTQYRQMEIIMQSLTCVCTTSTTSAKSVAMLVGTHADKVSNQEVCHVNTLVKDKVKPFLNSSLVYAKEDKLVLEVSIEKNDVCSNNPEDYKKVIMELVEKRLACPESEKLPAPWYMFSMILRRLQHKGYSVLKLSHCQEIAEKLYIKPTQLQSLLSRLHKVLGIVAYFPEVEQLKDLVICDPGVIYKGISELIFESFHNTTSPMLSLRLKNWGIFSPQELMKAGSQKKEGQLQVNELLIILQHLGIIAPTGKSLFNIPSAEEQLVLGHSLNAEYIIPCRLNDAPPEHLLQLQLQDNQALSITPLRIYFNCGFSPMGGFCYLFTKMINEEGWELLLPDDPVSDNSIYWRNKVTFKVDEKYFVTLLSTDKYYEVDIICAAAEEPFQLGTEGHDICERIWNAISNVLSNSLNAHLQEYKTGCQCIVHEHDDGHVMIFDHNPDEDTSEVKAVCRKTKATVFVPEAKQSVMVWFKV